MRKSLSQINLPPKQVTKKKGKNVKQSKVRRYNVPPDKSKSLPRSSPGFFPVMSKRRKPEDIPPMVRWLDRNEDRFDSPVEALRAFQDTVCEHRRLNVAATYADKTGSAKKLTMCEACGKLTK